MGKCMKPACKGATVGTEKLCEEHKGKCIKCGAKGVAKEIYCANHLRMKQQEDQKQAAQKKKIEDDLEESKEEREEMALESKKKELAIAAKKKKIADIALIWNGQVNAVVTQVKKLRSDKKNPAINAGVNAQGTTLGGNGNPVVFVLPKNDFGITRGEVFNTMPGFDSSDSGDFKFRIGDILVHGK